MTSFFRIFILAFIQPLWAASHHPEDFLKTLNHDPQAGQKIVQHFCANCHAEKPLIPLGAPRPGVLADWKPRMKQGLAAMLQRTDEGIGAMPPRGGCFECSDIQLKLAVLALLPDPLK